MLNSPCRAPVLLLSILHVGFTQPQTSPISDPDCSLDALGGPGSAGQLRNFAS